MSAATTFLYLSTGIAFNAAFFQKERIARMLIFLQKDVDKFLIKSDEQEEKLFEEMHKYIKAITVSIWIPTAVAAFIAYVEAFYRIAFGSFWYPTGEDDSDTPTLLNRLFPFGDVFDNTFFGFFLPLYALLIGVVAIPLWHTFITSLMIYVILKWKVMHKRLSEMDVSKVILEPNEILYHSSLVGDENKINFLRERMCKFCVVEQIRIRWFARELQELIGIPVFADFIIFSILICFLFYELVTGNPTNMDFVFMCLYLFVMSSILWLYHWHATLIKENSVEMGFAIYSCDWYNYPIKVQKLIQMAMIITARPLEIKAVLVPLSLTTFIDIIRAAYSYFSLLRKTSR
ncbi:odorant receptor 56a isoform X2 [Episyrphus balteatus]|nr:odorant receptor 56a isoform X2 [Episyrphus balteatus]